MNTNKLYTWLYVCLTRGNIKKEKGLTVDTVLGVMARLRQLYSRFLLSFFFIHLTAWWQCNFTVSVLSPHCRPSPWWPSPSTSHTWTTWRRQTYRDSKKQFHLNIKLLNYFISTDRLVPQKKGKNWISVIWQRKMTRTQPVPLQSMTPRLWNCKKIL